MTTREMFDHATIRNATIGDPVREIEVTPAERPIEEPAPVEPVREPEKEPVPA